MGQTQYYGIFASQHLPLAEHRKTSYVLHQPARAPRALRRNSMAKSVLTWPRGMMQRTSDLARSIIRLDRIYPLDGLNRRSDFSIVGEHALVCSIAPFIRGESSIAPTYRRWTVRTAPAWFALTKCTSACCCPVLAVTSGGVRETRVIDALRPQVWLRYPQANRPLGEGTLGPTILSCGSCIYLLCHQGLRTLMGQVYTYFLLSHLFLDGHFTFAYTVVDCPSRKRNIRNDAVDC